MDFGYHHPNFDGQSASRALRELLEIVFTWRNEQSLFVNEIDLSTIPPQYQGDVYADQCHSHIYQCVACSNAATGSLAPCFEGLFLHEFALLHEKYGGCFKANSHERWRLTENEFWAPSVVSENGTKRDMPDLVRGIQQLLTALGIDDHFPADMMRTLKALFAFRNRALHQGYEWPVESRESFERRVKDEGWGNFFTIARFGDQPWMIYATDTLVSEALTLFDRTQSAFHGIRKSLKP